MSEVIPYMVHYCHTLKCMLSCDFCFALEDDAPPMGDAERLEMMDILRDVPVFKITGGEPLLEYDSLKPIVERRPFVSIHTTGIPLDDEMLGFFERYEGVRLSFSLDGADAQANAAMRGYGPFFDEVTSLVRDAKRRGIEVSIKTLVSRKNYAHLYDCADDMVSLVNDLSPVAWKLEEFIPANRGCRHAADFELDDGLFDRLRAVYEGLSVDPNLIFVSKESHGSFPYFLISPSGGVYTSDIPKERKVGHILEDPLHVLYGRVRSL